MNQRLLSGPVPWGTRIVAGLLALVGIAVAALVVVFSFFVGAAVIGVAALLGTAAYVRFKFGKPILPRPMRRNPASDGNVIDGEFEVIRRER